MSGRTIGVLVVVESLLAIGLVNWRASRPAAPKLNLERMSVLTAKDLESLRQAADRGGAERWFEYGQACLANGYLLEAEAVLGHVLKLRPDDLDARWFLARTREKLGDSDGAISEYERILSVPATGREPICWYRIGRNHLRAERLVEARAAFDRAGIYPAAMIEKSRLLLRDGALEEAGRLIQDLQKQPVPDVYVEMLAVELARQRGNPFELAKALERLERSQGVLESQREWSDVELIRSRLGLERRQIEISLLRAKQPASALRVFRDLLGEIPAAYTDPFSTVALQLALQARDLGALDSMKAHYERRVALPPLAQHYVAQAYWEGKDEQRVEAASRSANALLPMTETSEHLATIAGVNGDQTEAKKMAALAFFVEGTTQYRLSQFPRASQMLEQAVTLNPENAKAWFYLGELEFARGDLENAIARYQQCLEVDPRHGFASARLAALQSAP